MRFLNLFIKFKCTNVVEKMKLSAQKHKITRRNVNPTAKVTNKKKPFTLESRDEIVKVLDEPIKSESDKKSYKVIRLQNGLTALLISDPNKPSSDDLNSVSSDEEPSSGSGDETESGSEANSDHGSDASDKVARRQEFEEEKMAACALSVGVGSYSDPEDIQGLAHFVEHMVFMGSEKYPKENDFDAFIKKKGGSDNASTDCEMTTFYFEIQEKFLLQAMDKFSHFFVSPLMLKESMQREREAIESEFALALPSDGNRKEQLLCSLFPAGHPATKFTWGNIKSLKQDVDDEYLYKSAHEFRRRHYSAHRMTLAVQARLSLETLEKYVIDTFSLVPSNNLKPDDFNRYNFNSSAVTKQFNSVYYVKPISDTIELQLTWQMKSLVNHYQSKPHQYISFLLGHEGKGSLLSYLKSKVWALGIYAGNDERGVEYTTFYSMFSTQIILTEQGYLHLDEVVEAVFSYINMLKKLGPNERIFNELRSIEENNFRFQEESQPSEYVDNLVENMHLYPPEHYITGDSLYYKYDPEAITDLLDHLNANTVNIMVLSKSNPLNITYDMKEKWFGTEYSVKEIEPSVLERWARAEPYAGYHLPDENVYIPTDFELLEPSEEYKRVAELMNIELSDNRLSGGGAGHFLEDYPVTLRDDEYAATIKNFRLDQPNLLRKNCLMEVWYKPDYKFKLPTAILYFYFMTPFTLSSYRDACLLDVWTDLVVQDLKESVYPAEMAELSFAMYNGDRGLTVKLVGYNQKIHLLADVVSTGMVSAVSRASTELLKAVCDVRARAYHNLVIKPSKLNKDIRLEVLVDPHMSVRHKAKYIHNITLDELNNFNRRLLNSFYMKMFVHGNLKWSDSLRIAENVYDNIKWKGIQSDSDMTMFKVREIPRGTAALKVAGLNPDNGNTVVTNYYQIGVTNPRDVAIIEMLMLLMEEPLFDRLRTKEQLGYSVFSLMRYTFGVLGYSITVNTQAEKFSAQHVDDRIENFLRIFARDIRRLTEKSFESTRQSLLKLKHAADVELKEEAGRHWKEISSHEYQFQRLRTETDAIESLKLSDLKTWVNNYIVKKENTRKLSVQVVGHVKSKCNCTTQTSYNLNYLTSTEETAANTVQDIELYKQGLSLYNVDSIYQVYNNL